MIVQHDDLQPDKRPWRSPEMIDVGGALDLTQAVAENVRESNSASPPSFDLATARTVSAGAEVEFPDS